MAIARAIHGSCMRAGRVVLPLVDGSMAVAVIRGSDSEWHRVFPMRVVMASFPMDYSRHGARADMAFADHRSIWRGISGNPFIRPMYLR